MKQITVNSLKNGITFSKDGNLYVLLDSSHSKSGRGQAHVKMKVRNLKTGSVQLMNFTSNESVESAFVEKKKLQFLYEDGNNVYFNDLKTFEEYKFSLDFLGDKIFFIVPGNEIQVLIWNNEIFGVELDSKIKLRVVKSSDAVKGNTVSSAMKKATLETNLEIEVPQFINEGDVIIVSSETKKYISKEK